ncbi:MULTISPECIES: extracellular solute-binding protein [Pseudomonas syringae group]|uniref:ABC-type nickel/dipeptide/oligopeptide-type transport system n=1 Tax=Pseudomonas coronafaciens pv. striafaciens TaxID=235276 RepID=A0A3M4XUM6_9PSED|nr:MULTISPECIES: extracellular solute-binding protein [Pseudomonas syringae group]QVI72036.1 ABC transporter substrate-binding protein [Pseudomonas syringae]RMR80101.1 ABC-type nickel/dipeptide/oligopeptide-type transport system [Pseudomonas coronafaciens pv. striafaciens]
MNPLHSLRSQAAGLLLASLACTVQAAPQHGVTLYDEAPKYPADFKHFDYVNPDAPKGGTLRQAGFGGFDSLNPFINKGVPADDIGLIYDTLARSSLDEPFTEYGLVAGKIEKSPDNSWVRFYLRPEARFHDGHPIRADDVEFSFKTLMEHGSPMYKGYYADVDQVIVEDPLRVLFKFKHKGSRELPLILGQLPVLPKHFWADRDFSKGNLDFPLGSGPYKVADVKAGRSVSYERVKDYWAKDLPINKGFYNFDVLTTDYYRDNTVALEAGKAGQFDYWIETSAKNWATAYDTPAVRDGRLIKEELPNGNPTGMQGFVFNLRKPVFQDVRVREALTLLLDFEWTNKQLFNGSYSRTKSYFDNSEMAASGLPSAEELKLLEPLRGKIPDRVFSEPFTLPVTDGSGMIRPQQRRAFQLLQEAGWKIVDDKMVDAQGNPVKIEFLMAQTEFERILLPYKRNLSDLGIELVIRRADVSQYINRLRSRDYDMIVTGYPQSSSPGNEQRVYFDSSSADNPGSRNFMGLKDPAVDSLVNGLINADSRQSLITHTKALDRVLLWGFYVVPNWHIKTWRVAYWNHLDHPKAKALSDIGLMTWWARPDVKPATATPSAPDQAKPANAEQ